jgi:DNA-binding NarL/FixJ family response regulator
MKCAGPELLEAQSGHKKGDVQLTAAQASAWPTLPGKNRTRPRSVLFNAQKQIMQFMADGHTFKEIAFALGLTESTVKYYSSRMYFKLREAGFPAAVDKASTVALALRKGWIK